MSPSASAAVGEPLLHIDQLSLTIHGTPILNDIGFTLERGKTLGVIGESGSGKSMTALSIMQLLPRGAAASGTIRFEGLSILEQSEAALCRLRGGDIGMIFQEPMTALNPVRTIGEQVAESVMIHTGASRRDAFRRAAETLEHVDLPNAHFPLGRYPHELSGGQRQRVGIAIAVACGPRLLIADEPTTALDVTTQASILDLLRRLQQESGMALMLITHDLALVADMADTLVIMRDGEVLERGSRDAVFRHPQHAYTKMLFRASAMIDGRSAPTNTGTIISADGAPSTEGTPVAAASAEPLLEVDKLSVDYPVRRRGLWKPQQYFRAVDAVSFALYPGENLGLVGESGCGKSTLTRALLGLTTIAEGSVRLLGKPVASERQVTRAARRDMQVVFQDPYGSFNPRHRVARLISEPLHLLDRQPSKAERSKLIVESLENVGLESSDAERYIHEFSGGQRQRIAIARALMLHPKLIILDEAVSALDVSVRAQVLKLLRRLGDDQGLAYLFISHDLSVVEQVSDRVLVMNAGRIVERGVTQEVFATPRHRYTRELVAAAPKLPPWTALGA